MSQMRSIEKYSHEFGIPMKLVTLIKMHLSEIHRKLRIRKNMSDALPF
jgi:hypothetical protein